MKTAISSKNLGIILFSITILMRLIPTIYTPLVADLSIYYRAGQSVLMGNTPYTEPGLYSYPPLWIWMETSALWLSSFFNFPFQILIKLPLLISDGLVSFLVYKLALLLTKKHAFFLGLFYAINPISILITGFHGQFDTMVILMVLLAVYTLVITEYKMSGIFFSIAVALKSFPILLLPFFLFHIKGKIQNKIKYITIVLFPTVLLVLPYFIFDFVNIKRELFSYSGYPDHGLIAIIRALQWIKEGRIILHPQYINNLLFFSKIIFLIIFLFIIFITYLLKRKSSLNTMICLTFCLFYIFYGGISSQYLLWLLPLLIILDVKSAIYYSLFVTTALISFYLFFYPDVIMWFFNFHIKEKLLFYLIASIILYLNIFYLFINKVIPRWFRGDRRNIV